MSHFGDTLVRLPITRGTLRGSWWLPASRGKILRILGGTYEREQTRAFGERVKSGDTVLDVGANVGYYTLLASVLAGDGGRVFAFEPDPRNVRWLRRHVHINGRQNVRIEEAAVADMKGTARFERGTGSGTGHLTRSGGFDVRVLRLDDFCADRGLRPNVVKIDVEGAETAVLNGARETLELARPIVFLSTHGADIHRRCLELMEDARYDAAPLIGDDVASCTELICTPR